MTPLRADCLIDGSWVEATAGAGIDVLNPATGERVATVPDLSPPMLRHALDGAEAARPQWSARPPADRAGIVRTIGALVRRDADRLAALMTSEQGKPLAEARGEVSYAASYFEAAADLTPSLMDAPLRRQTLQSGKQLEVWATGCGLTASITPWNFPLAMIARKLAPALATGCTQVVKPDERTPLSALALAELCVEAGVPGGAAQFVTCAPRSFADEVFRHDRVRFVSFTGSTAVGRHLIAQSAERVIRLGLELGGLAPFIVLHDADLDRAVAQCAASKFRNAGQTCICANRILVHRSLASTFAERLAAHAGALVVGRGDAPGVAVGPLIDDAAIAKVERHVADAIACGGRLLIGGRRARVAGCLDRFYEPTVIMDATPDAMCFREETFGPVAPILAFDSEDEALAIANAAPYGLSAYIFSQDTSRAAALARRIEAGIVGFNDGLPSNALAPFGGIKQSGWGREGGPEGILEYCDLRMLSLGG